MPATRDGRKTQPFTAQQEVVMGALAEMGSATAEEVAEALTLAQQYLPPSDRIAVPVTGRTAGQYLGYLLDKGLVACDPPRGVTSVPRGRAWSLTGALALVPASEIDVDYDDATAEPRGGDR